MRSTTKKSSRKEQGEDCSRYRSRSRSRDWDNNKGYDSPSEVNDIGPENEGDEGYYTDTDSEDGLPYSKGPRFEKFDDAIPAQSVFITRAQHRLACVDVVAPANRIKAICAFFNFILQPAYAPFHRCYGEWRSVLHKKCDEFLAETTDATLRSLCEQFKAEFA